MAAEVQFFAAKTEFNQSLLNTSTCRPKFLRQEEVTQYGVKNSCPSITWNLYGFPMPEVYFKFEGNDIEMGDKYSFSYSRNGVAALQVNSFGAADVGTYECFGKNEHGEASQQVIMVLAQYPEFIR